MKGACWMVMGLLVAGEAAAQGLRHEAPANGDRPAAATVADASATAPDASAVTVPVFRTGVDLVALNVVVTDGQQKFVSGLVPENFAVFEDGVRQDVTYFAATTLPLDLAILLDTSASMSDKMQTVQQAASGFAATLRPGDRAMVVDIKDASRVIQDLSPEIDGARQAIASTVARGGTALYNGLYLTLKALVKQRRDNDEVRRQAIVVFSDGDDTASLVTYDDVMAVAKEAGIAIYTITLRTPSPMQLASTNGRRYFSQADFAMRSLAQETGARAFFPTAITDLAGVYATIAEELASQYAIGYTSKNGRRDGAFRRVIVRIADHPGTAAPRTRAGYMAPRPERTAVAVNGTR